MLVGNASCCDGSISLRTQDNFEMKGWGGVPISLMMGDWIPTVVPFQPQDPLCNLFSHAQLPMSRPR